MATSTAAQVHRWLALHRRPVAATLTFLSVLLALSAVTGGSDSGVTDESDSPADVVAVEGQLAVPLQLEDDAVVALLRPGDRVDVLATSDRAPAQAVASGVTVSSVPTDQGGTWDTSREPVLVLVTAEQALALATASAQGTLSVALHPR